MKSSILPDSFLKRMSKADRAGQLTATEALEKFNCKSERDLQRTIANYLRLHGIWFMWQRTDKKTTTQAGCPDFIFCVHPYTGDITTRRAIALEVKFGNGDLSEEQKTVRSQMTANGWHYHVVRSLAEVQALLQLPKGG